MPTRELMSPDGQVVSDEELDAAVRSIVSQLLEAVDDSMHAQHCSAHLIAKVKQHVSHRATEYLTRALR